MLRHISYTIPIQIRTFSKYTVLYITNICEKFRILIGINKHYIVISRLMRILPSLKLTEL